MGYLVVNISGIVKQYRKLLLFKGDFMAQHNSDESVLNLKECQFDSEEGCLALACYDSTTKCNCRDEKGDPKYL